MVKREEATGLLYYYLISFLVAQFRSFLIDACGDDDATFTGFSSGTLTLWVDDFTFFFSSFPPSFFAHTTAIINWYYVSGTKKHFLPSSDKTSLSIAHKQTRRKRKKPTGFMCELQGMSPKSRLCITVSHSKCIHTFLYKFFGPLRSLPSSVPNTRNENPEGRQKTNWCVPQRGRMRLCIQNYFLSVSKQGKWDVNKAIGFLVIKMPTM